MGEVSEAPTLRRCGPDNSDATTVRLVATAMNAIVQYLVEHGCSVLFASVFASQMCLPVPAILFLFAAGSLAGCGRLTLAIVLGLALLARLLADIVWYEAGRRWGDQILHFI